MITESCPVEIFNQQEFADEMDMNEQPQEGKGRSSSQKRRISEENLIMDDSFDTNDSGRYPPKVKNDSFNMTRESSYSLEQKSKPEPTSKQEHSSNVVVNNYIDWYGNSCLHHLFAGYDVNCYLVQKAVQNYPELISHCNQFGRIPLHYAVDRSQVNIKGLEILLKAYPEGASLRDNDGMTPYDVAVKWEHSKMILMYFLNINPSLDNDTYIKLKYGPIGSFAVWARNSFRGQEEDDETNGEGDDHLEDTSDILTKSPTIFALSRSQSRRFSANSIHAFTELPDPVD